MEQSGKLLTARVRRTWALCVFAFLCLGTPAIVMRAARSGEYPQLKALRSLASTDATVGLEHFAAGIGVPAGILAVFLILYLACDRVPARREMSPRMIAFIVLLIGVAAGVAYGFHIWEHESEQAFRSVYGGPPRGTIQWWQVMLGWSGIITFWYAILYEWLVVCRRLWFSPSAAIR